MGPLQLILIIRATARSAGFGLDQVLVARQHPLPIVIHTAPLAQAHGCRRGIDLGADLLQPREGHVLAIAQEVLGQERRLGGHRIGNIGLRLDIQIRDQERLRKVTVRVRHRSRAVATGRGHDIVIIKTISGESVHLVFIIPLRDRRVRVEDERLGSPGITVIIIQSIKVIVVMEDPIGRALVHQAVT